MENGNVEMVQLELKYCERCGGLWLRQQGVDEVYCAFCALQMKDCPAPRGLRPKRGLPDSDRLEIKGGAGLFMFCGEGGHA